MVSSRKGSERSSSHQANSICLRFIDIVKDVSIRHHLSDHRKLPDLRFDSDRNKLMDIRMRHIHPNHAFLAEGLDLVFLLDKLSGMVKQAA